MMDRALKERIIGAIVLVVFVVLVVPVFLDGPPPDNDVISEPVPLPGQEQQPVKVIVLERDRTEPVPSTVDTQPAEAVPAQVQAAESSMAEAAAQQPAPEPEPKVEPEPAPSEPPETASAPVQANESEPEPREAAPIRRATSSATGMYAVQLGSFSSAENANRLAADLRQKGFAAFLSKTESGGEELHRVRIGPQKDRPAAEAMAARLEDAGHSGQVVPHP